MVEILDAALLQTPVMKEMETVITMLTAEMIQCVALTTAKSCLAYPGTGQMIAVNVLLKVKNTIFLKKSQLYKILYSVAN